MNTLSFLASLAALAVVFTILVVAAYNHWLGIGDPSVSPNPKQKEKNSFAIVAIVFFLAVGACAIGFVVINGHHIVSSLKKQDTTPVLAAPVPPTPHEAAVQKQLEQEMRDVHARQMALSAAQEAALRADREHIAKQREQELKAQKRNDQLAAFQRFTEQSAKTAENGLKLLERISKQPAPVVNFTSPAPVVNMTTTSAPPAITVNVPATTNIFQVQSPTVNLAVSNHNPITVQSPAVTIQPVPVSLTLSNHLVTTATVSSGAPTQSVTKLPLLPAPPVTSAPPAPQAPVKVKVPKAPATPAVAPKNTTTKTVVTPAPKAPAFKAGRVLVKHISTVTLNKGAKEWWGIGVLARKLDGRESKGGQVITREYTLAVDVKTQEDLAVAQSALDLFIAHKAKELADNDDYVKDGDTAQQANFAKLFNVFVSQRPSLNPLSGMNPEIKFKVLPGPTGT